jgi:CubicO group peptidase (beta-lactamase class C family)
LILLGCALISRSQDLTARLDTLLQAYTSLYKFNGTALVAKNGTVLLDKGYGYRNGAAGVRHDKNSIFHIGSVTKQFTTAQPGGSEKPFFLFYKLYFLCNNITGRE